MKHKIAFPALLCLFFSAHSMPFSKPIGVGDKLPDLTVSHILNSPLKTINLSDYKGRLLIIDFWATSCGSCITALPRLDKLQRLYGDSIAILTVSYEKTAIVAAFLARNPTGKTMRLPVATDDIELAALFPHRMLSHEVWIDRNGVVRAITEAEYVNEKNISAMLRNPAFTLPLKNDEPAYDYTKSLLSRGNAVFYSMVSPYQPGVTPKFGIKKDSVNHTVRTWIVNFPILTMYMLATDHLLYFPKNLLDIRLKDSTLVRQPAGAYRNAWKPGHYFCYECVLPAGASAAQIKASMLADLNRFFRLDGRMEKKKAKCLALERLATFQLPPATRGGIPLNTLHRKDTLKVLNNASLSDIIWELNDIPGALPAIDESGITGNVDMTLAVSSFRDLAALNRALQPYGLTLKEEERELEFFVLTDAATN